MTVPDLLTIGIMAKLLDQTSARITRIVRELEIQPAAMVGKTRVFTNRDLERVQAAVIAASEPDIAAVEES
jgi:hypothetical protein